MDGKCYLLFHEKKSTMMYIFENILFSLSVTLYERVIFGKEAFADELIRDPNIVSVLSTSEICVRGTTFAP